jgi:hypothetical protein
MLDEYHFILLARAQQLYTGSFSLQFYPVRANSQFSETRYPRGLSRYAIKRACKASKRTGRLAMWTNPFAAS